MEDTEDFISIGDLAGHELRLHRMSGDEMLGGMFEYRVEVASQEANIEPKDVLGEKLSIKIRLPDKNERFFNGHVTSWSYGGRLHDRTIYHLTLHPWLWLLGFTSDCRVFNGRSALEIVTRVFSKYGQADFNASPIVASDYPPYEHCVQYRETDLNFVLRLLQYEGIYFFFKHETDRHVLTLADGLGAHATRPGYEEIPYMPPTTNARGMSPHFNLCTFRQDVQTRSYWHQDFDFKNPHGSLLAFCPSNQQQQRYRTGEMFDYPGLYVDHARGQTLARTRLDEKHEPTQVIDASGNPLGLSTGDLFTLPNPPWGSQAVKFLVTSAHYDLDVPDEHSGGIDDSKPPYAARYTLIPQDEPFRPARTAPRPVVPGPQTAIVVGYKKNVDQEPEEIVTDEYGRVRVRFHWERVGHAYPESRGLKDDNEDSDTCWIRVAQKWAGSRWGSIHIPRVGHEVVVEFLEGDPDRPLITGSVYNDANKPPYDLPKHMTQSGIKSRSTKGGNPDNFNEIRFEDLKGKEELHIQAERDMSTLVKATQSTTVGGDRTVTVSGKQATEVTKDEAQTYHANRKMIVDGTNLEEVGKMHTGVYSAGRTVSVDGADDVLSVSTNKTIVVTGSCAMAAGDQFSVAHAPPPPPNTCAETAPDASIILTKDNIAIGNASKSLVTLDKTKLTIDAPDSIALVCGDACITMSKDGTIRIVGKTKVDLSGGNTSAVALDSSGATITGFPVKLNS